MSTSLPTRSLRRLVALVALGATLCTPTFAAEDTEPRRIATHLRADAFRELAQDGFFALPQFRVYSADGVQVLDTGTGFDPGTFALRLEATLDEPQPNGAALTLEQEIERLELSQGGTARDRLGLPRPDEIVIVKYEAEWCAPCHEQSRVLRRLLAERDDPPVTIVVVDTEPRNNPTADSFSIDDLPPRR